MGLTDMAVQALNKVSTMNTAPAHQLNNIRGKQPFIPVHTEYDIDMVTTEEYAQIWGDCEDN